MNLTTGNVQNTFVLPSFPSGGDSASSKSIMSARDSTIALSWSKTNVEGTSWFMKMPAPNAQQALSPPQGQASPGPYDTCPYVLDPTPGYQGAKGCPCHAQSTMCYQGAQGGQQMPQASTVYGSQTDGIALSQGK